MPLETSDAPFRIPQFDDVERAAPSTQKRPFNWEGRTLYGAAGDTLASALAANGVVATGRSALFGRPRGLGALGPAPSGGWAMIGRGVGPERLEDPALVELEDGLSARLPTAAEARRGPPSAYDGAADAATAFCDALIIGAGPAGVEAARTLAEAGWDALLIDRDFALGGGLLGDPSILEGGAGAEWLAAKQAALGRAGARRMLRAEFLGFLEDGAALISEREPIHAASAAAGRRRLWRVRAEAAVLATGGIEARGAFGANDLPGVTTASALRTGLARFGVLAGRRIVIATADESGYLGLEALTRAGASVTILDMRDAGAARRAAGVPGVGHRHGLVPMRALGRGRLRGVLTAARKGATWRAAEEFDADLLAVAGGWRPDPFAASAARAAEAALPIELAGAAAGAQTHAACARSGRNAALRLLGRPEEKTPERDDPAPAFTPPRFGEAEAGRRVFADLSTDRLASAPAPAEPDGRAEPAAEFEPPAAPRRSPLHAALTLRGFEIAPEAGWLQALRRRLPGETPSACRRREALAARRSVALADLSALGKIAVCGPDADAFLDRALTRSAAAMADETARDADLLADDGVLLAAATLWRFAPDAFWLTTAPRDANAVAARLTLLLQTRWPDLRAAITRLDDAFAGCALSGPRARRALTRLAPDWPLEDAATPPGAVRLPRLGPALCRVARLTRFGAPGYALFAPAPYGEALFETLADAVEALDGALIGRDAEEVLRVESGALGPEEINGRATLHDLGAHLALEQGRPFAGRPMAESLGQAAPDRPRLAAFAPDEPTTRLLPGATLARAADRDARIGWISSAAFSHARGSTVALGFIEGGVAAWRDRVVTAENPDGTRAALRVLSPDAFRLFDFDGGALEESGPEEISSRPAPTELPARTPLGGLASDPTARRVRSAEGARAASVRLEECAPQSFLRVVAWPGAFAAAEAELAARLGLKAAPAAGSSAAGGLGARAFRTGPLEWRVATDAPEMVARVSAAPAEICQTVDLSDATLRVRILGAAARALLQRCVDIDLRDAPFPIGSAATVALLGAPCLLTRIAAEDYALWIPRSLSEPIWEALARATDRL